MAPERMPPAEAHCYPYWVDEHVRFGDLDLLGHVNNKSYLGYAESARAPFLMEIGLWVVDSPRQGVIVHTAIDFRQELHYPNRLRIGVGTMAVGGRSYTLGQGVFCEERCVATILTTLVRIDTVTRRPVSLEADERERLLAWSLRPPGGE